MRKAFVSVLVGALAVVGGAVIPAGAQQEPTTTFVIEKVVVGPATAGSSVTISCESPARGGGAEVGAAGLEDTVEVVVLGFDAQGNPTTKSGANVDDFDVVDGAWVGVTSVPEFDANPACFATETDSGGAASTAWTCAFEFDAGTPDPPIGCDAATGDGVGPVVATFGIRLDEINEQTWTVVFTNTYPEAVEVEPNFTG